jgi:hypothetical protein
MRVDRRPRPALALTVIALTLVSAASAQVSPLAPEKAFRFSARALNPNTVEARFNIAEGYYLYRDKLRFAVEPAASGLAVPYRLDSHRARPTNQYRRGHHDLSELYAAMADPRTLSAAGLEHRGSVGRPASARAGQTRSPDPSHPPAGQSAFSPPPWGSG